MYRDSREYTIIVINLYLNISYTVLLCRRYKAIKSGLYIQTGRRVLSKNSEINRETIKNGAGDTDKTRYRDFGRPACEIYILL